MIIVLGMQKFLKRNWKQASEAADQYLNGVDVNVSSFDAAGRFFTGMHKKGIQGDALDAAIKNAGTDVQEGMALMGIAHSRTGAVDAAVNRRELMKMADKNGMIHVTGAENVAGIRQARGFTSGSDLMSAGAVAATGVIGFSAVAGAANLIRGED